MIFKRKNSFPHKIFCIGRNKTGTTSLKKMFELYNFKVGNQRTAEKLSFAYKKRDFSRIINYCNSAEVFQDFPFSYPDTFRYLDHAFPNAKFILTIRNSPEQWYESLCSYYIKLFGKNGKITSNDLKNATYVYKGWIYENVVDIFGTPEYDPLNKEILIDSYNNYNNHVIQYFKNDINKLLVLNLRDKESYSLYCTFLNLPEKFEGFPWLNKTKDIK